MLQYFNLICNTIRSGLAFLLCIMTSVQGLDFVFAFFESGSRIHRRLSLFSATISLGRYNGNVHRTFVYISFALQIIVKVDRISSGMVLDLVSKLVKKRQSTSTWRSLFHLSFFAFNLTNQNESRTTSVMPLERKDAPKAFIESRSNRS